MTRWILSIFQLPLVPLGIMVKCVAEKSYEYWNQVILAIIKELEKPALWLKIMLECYLREPKIVICDKAIKK